MFATASVFKRHRNLILFLVGLIIVFWLLYIFRSAIFPFALGLVFAYLVKPVISWAERKIPYKTKWVKAKRIFLILLIFIIVLGLFALLGFYLVNVVAGSFVILFDNAPEYIIEGLNALREWAESLRYHIPLGFQQQLDDSINELGIKLGNAIQDAFFSSLVFIPTTFGFILAFASLPLFLFYILKDAEDLEESFYSFFSLRIAVHANKIISIIDSVLGRYIRAQLLLGLVVACLVAIGLSILDLGMEIVPALAIFAGVTELIPLLGPWIGGAVGVIVTLATVPDKAIWVALVYLSVQLLENILLVPRIQGGYLRINPAILVVLLILGSYVAGLWGMLLIAPLTATAVEIFKYVRESAKVDEVDAVACDLSLDDVVKN